MMMAPSGVGAVGARACPLHPSCHVKVGPRVSGQVECTCGVFHLTGAVPYP